MATFSIMYLAVCESFFAIIMGCVGLFVLAANFFASSSGRGYKAYLVGADLVSIATFCIWAVASLIRKRPWAWSLSLIAGFIVVGMNCLIIWLALHADSRGDGGEAILFGIAFLIFALPAFVFLSFPSTRRYLSVEKCLESNIEATGD
jgi:hypothetical protein